MTNHAKFELDISSLLDLEEFTDSVLSPRKELKAEGEKYVVFHLDDKLYAVHSKQVVEVIGFLDVTTLPMVPEWLAGIANLRGNIIPVVNLRLLWKKETTTPQKTKLLVLRSEKDHGTIAFVVDKLSEIVTLTAKEIQFSAADFESSFPTFFGRAAFKSQTLYLLDAENLFSSLSTTAGLLNA
jgi:purine-binding chemotaxis protein CheW